MRELSYVNKQKVVPISILHQIATALMWAEKFMLGQDDIRFMFNSGKRFSRYSA